MTDLTGRLRALLADDVKATEEYRTTIRAFDVDFSHNAEKAVQLARDKKRNARSLLANEGLAALPDLLTTLETLTQENARLREALEPFAQTTVLEPNGVIVGLERFHFDRARKALEAK